MADGTRNGRALLVVRLERENEEDEVVWGIPDILQSFGIAGEIVGRWRTRAMTDGTRTRGTFTLVGLEREDADVSRNAMEILRLLGIPDEEVERGQRLCDAPFVVLSVPHKRVAEAILALESQGYADVLAYKLENGPLGKQQ